MDKENEAVLDDTGITIRAGTKVIYNFLADTGEYMGSNEEHLPVGVGIPACSTLLPNPECHSGYVAIFDLDSQNWSVEEDHRGKMAYSMANGEPLEITSIGPVPNGYTLHQPQTAADEWDGMKWALDEEKAQELAVIEAENKKNSLLAEANTECNELMVDYNLGLLSEKQTEVLKLWRIYIRDLKEVDTSKAPNIGWPVLPEV